VRFGPPFELSATESLLPYEVDRWVARQVMGQIALPPPAFSVCLCEEKYAQLFD
jgi:hypothetical protein